MKTALRPCSGQAEETEHAERQPSEYNYEKKRAAQSAQPSIHEPCSRYCGFGFPSGSTVFFISWPVALVPFFTPLPVFLATFAVPLAVSFATTLVSWPVFSAPFSVSLAVSFATTLVSWPVFSAPFFTSVAAS